MEEKREKTRLDNLQELQLNCCAAETKNNLYFVHVINAKCSSDHRTHVQLCHTLLGNAAEIINHQTSGSTGKPRAMPVWASFKTSLAFCSLTDLASDKKCFRQSNSCQYDFLEAGKQKLRISATPMVTFFFRMTQSTSIFK